MKKILTSLLGLIVMGTLYAQEVDKSVVQSRATAAQKAAEDLKKVDTGEKPWKFSGTVGLNAAATGMWNWAAGGNNNVNGVASTKLRLLYHENNMSWETNLDMEYGLSWIDQEFDQLQKTSDKINFSTKFGWEFHKTWYLTVLGGFQSQFAYGRDYNGSEAFDPIISKWLAPSYTDISVGIDWKPNDIFSIYLSPVAGRLTTVYVSDALNKKSLGMMDKVGTEDEYAVYPDGLEYALKDKYAVWHYTTDENGLVTKNRDKNLRAELGLSLKGSINYTYKDLKILTTLSLYTPYAWDKTKVYQDSEGQLYADLGNGQDFSNMEYVGFRDNNRRFGNFDVDWDVSVSYQFLKCLQVSLTTSLKYYNGTLIEKFDKEGNSLGSAERVQFKSVIGLGIGYTF